MTQGLSSAQKALLVLAHQSACKEQSCGGRILKAYNNFQKHAGMSFSATSMQIEIIVQNSPPFLFSYHCSGTIFANCNQFSAVRHYFFKTR